ncbi:MAG: GCN5-related N-acetyltransferase [Herbinix sp.]|jgi:ribosomal protein S18 acetylase RimI-like enzyme|nr:GCN5-related N-acetyltransferase [Herbinix sp.]
MLHSRKVTEVEFEDMIKDCYTLISGYSAIEGENQVDWHIQMAELMPNGMESAGNYLYTFLNEEEQVIGYAWCSDKEDSMRLIAYIGVKESFRRRGYATQIMEMICRDAKQAGVSLMVLGVEKNNFPAIHIYERDGFKIVGEEDIRFIMVKEL